MKKIGTEKALEIVQKIAAKAGEKKLSEVEVQLDVQLAFWPEEILAMPNSLARSAIFAVIKRGRRRLLDNEKIASRQDGLITMSGKQLDQADADTWMHLMSLAKNQSLGTRIHINRRDVLLSMKRSIGSAQYQWLEESIGRLHQASIRVETKRYKAALHLIGNYLFDKDTGEYWIEIQPEAASLFGDEMFGWIDIERRYALGQNDLAKWLQCYAHSHKQGEHHTVSVELLHSWCGASGRLRSFRDSLRNAIEALCAHGIIEGGRIRDDDKVTWYRPHNSARDAIEMVDVATLPLLLEK